MKLKDGTRVIIKKDLSESDDVPFSVNNSMERYRGQVMTIINGGFNNSHQIYAYTMLEDRGDWTWNYLMFDYVVNDDNKLIPIEDVTNE